MASKKRLERHKKCNTVCVVTLRLGRFNAHFLVVFPCPVKRRMNMAQKEKAIAWIIHISFHVCYIHIRLPIFYPHVLPVSPDKCSVLSHSRHHQNCCRHYDHHHHGHHHSPLQQPQAQPQTHKQPPKMAVEELLGRSPHESRVIK